VNRPCLIIDDEPSSQNVLKSFIHKIDYLDFLHICNKTLEALEYLKNNFLITYKSLKEMYNSLPKSIFIRVHKSFISNKNKLDYMESNFAIINANKIPLGQKHKKKFLEYFNT